MVLQLANVEVKTLLKSSAHFLISEALLVSKMKVPGTSVGQNTIDFF